MVVWGGATADYPTTYFDTGARYDPATDDWTPISMIGAPSGRFGHTILWDGREAIVWGGEGNSSSGLDTGGLYDPIADAWTSIATIDAPAGRWSHSAVWTGHEMIVWGGIYGIRLRTGGRYDPARDAWTATSVVDAPSGRAGHMAVWTGSSMVIWGDESTGGRYIPDPLGEIRISTDATRTIECAGVDGTRVGLSATAHSCNLASELTFSWSGPFPEGGGVQREPGPMVTLPLGTNHLTLTVVDSDGRRATESVVASVLDTTPPVLACPGPGPVECTSPSGAEVFISPAQVTDACDSSPVVVNSHGPRGRDASGTFALGQTEVEVTAGDSSGNSTSCVFPVAVVDTTPPQISLTVAPTVLWPPNHRMVPERAAWQVTDVCDPAAGAVLASATSSEPDDAPDAGDGNTSGDIQAALDGTTANAPQLRAERSADGPGRTYTLRYQTRDASGNTTSALGVVTVPHDLGTGPEPLLMNLEPDGTSGMAHLYWNEVPGALKYDVIQGNLDQATAHSGTLWLGPVHVLASGVAATSYREGSTGAVPATGKAFFYLVQYWDAQAPSGWGTETAPWPEEPTRCDLGCPGGAGGSPGPLSLKHK